MRTGFRAGLGVVVGLVVVGFVVTATLQFLDKKSSERARNAAASAVLPGTPVDCSEVGWASTGSRCSRSPATAHELAEQMLNNLRAAGLDNAETSCVGKGATFGKGVPESCSIFVRYPRHHGVVVVVLPRLPEGAHEFDGSELAVSAV